jgi:hypothetical protein
MKEHVIETKEVFSSSQHGAHHHINEYLKLGWVIVDTWIQDIGERGVKDGRLHALMGWIDRSRPAVHPKD